MNLYWVETDDHHEDWFIMANSKRQAQKIHEDEEGYDRGDAEAKLITRIPEVNVTKPGYPSFEVLNACGGKILRAKTPHYVEIGGKGYAEGMLQHHILSIQDDRSEAKGKGRPNRTTRLEMA